MKSKWFTPLALITLALLSWGLYEALVAAPTERTMGDVQRIFYYHVPLAWTAMLCCIGNFIASCVYLGYRKPAVDALALTFAEVGVVFATAFLATGILWARPVWGIWWTWDARLTGAFVLWLIYVAYLILRKFSSGGGNPVLAASFSIFGAIDTVFVWMAIRWFRTQHPQPVFAGGANSGLDPRMLKAFLINLLAFTVFCGLVIWVRYTLERLKQRVEEMHAMAALTDSETKVLR